NRMGRKLYEFTIKMSGKMSRSFTNTFDNASQRTKDMRKKISEYQSSIEKANDKLKSMSNLHQKMSASMDKTKKGLAALEQKYRSGAISEQVYRRESEKLKNDLQRFTSVQKRATAQVDKFKQSVSELNREMRSESNNLASYSRQLETMETNAMAAGVSIGEIAMAGAALLPVGAYLGTVGVGLAGIAVGAKTAQTAFGLMMNSVEKAAEREYNIEVIESLLRDQKKADKLFNWMESRAIESRFGMNDFMESGQAFLFKTKDLKQVEALIDISEKLGTINKQQGMQGGAIALNELLIGDTQSIVERFNMPRSDIKKFAKSGIDGIIKGMNELLAKQNIDAKLLSDVDTTGLVMYEQLVEKLQITWAKMGSGALDALKPALREIDELTQTEAFRNMADLGSEMFTEMGNAISHSVEFASDRLQTIFDNPEFQKLDVWGKIEFIVGDVYDTFNKWWSSGGKDSTQRVTYEIATKLGDLIKAAAVPLIPVAQEVGYSVGQSIIQGLWDGLWEENKLETPFSKLEARIEQMKASGLDPTTTPVYGGPNATMTAAPEQAWYAKTWDWINGSHKNGLPYVPFDGYRAELHEGERVLTAKQNQNLDSNLWSAANHAYSSPNTDQNANMDANLWSAANKLLSSGERNADRASNLWSNANKLLSSQSGNQSTIFHYSPTINGGNRAENEQLLIDSYNDFVVNMRRFTRQERAVSFS
ncbi:hypothetical protein SD939_10480, partial [Lactobacillus crispatus]|uniref:hypothetical protein n=1 Tax=Lactobacillus crispatus TaxID=47770 RepID=UPI0029C3CD72